MICFLALLLQDFCQVLLMGILLVPDLFLLMLILYAVLPQTDSAKVCNLIWMAFFGCLIWDLRWTNMPGLSAGLGSIIAGLSYFLWRKIPVQGRNAFSFIIFSFLFEIAYAALHYLFWTMPSQSAMRQFLIQQLAVIPLLIILSCLYVRLSKNDE